MSKLTLALVVFVVACGACGDNLEIARILDASPDGCGPDPDADADLGCCAFYPDENAIRACGAMSLPIGACAVLACPVGCSFARINVCHRFPACSTFECVAIACDEQAQCTCELASGEYVSCDGTGGV
jgi:hypothetical protein